MDIVWDSEGMVHRASLTTLDNGTAILYITRIRGTEGATATLQPEERRTLASALLEGLPDENE